MMGVAEATTSAIGEELNKLFGFFSTRLTAESNPESQVQSAIGTMSYDGNVTCTLTAGQFLLSIASPLRVRILSGAASGAEALVSIRNSNIQITLQTKFYGQAAFVNASWEIVEDADTTLEVENALDFAPAASPGRVVLDGIIYFYAGTTATTITGLTYDDGTGLIKSGVAQYHKPLSLCTDFSRFMSAVDKYRRSFLVAYAEGEDLNILGSNLGVDRPPELTDDEIFRRLIMAVAYAPRGTLFAAEQVLDVLLGETVIASGVLNASGTGDPYTVTIYSGAFPTDIEGERFRVKTGYLSGRTVRIKARISGTQIQLNIPMSEDFRLESWEITKPNWEIFEDLTSGSLHHGCTFFVRRTDDAATGQNPNGKAFLDGEDNKPLATTTTINYTGMGRLRTCGVRLKDEGGVQTIASGSGATAASSADGITITAANGTFPTIIKQGDYFQLANGLHRGLMGVVQSRTNDHQLVLGLVDGSTNPSPTATGALGVAFSGVSWQIFRNRTNCRFYRPSAESRIEYPGDAGTQTWFYLGANENTRTSVTSDTTYGAYLLLNPANDVVVYERPLRITPEANASVEIYCDVGTGCTSGVADGKQFCLLLSDGERTLAWGVIDNVGNADTKIGFIDVTTGHHIGTTKLWGDVAATKYLPGMNAVRLVKHGRDQVQLFRQAWQGATATTYWELVATASYTSFPAIAAWVAAAPYVAKTHEIAWGTIEAGHSNQTVVKYVDWHVENNVDFWNLQKSGASTTNPAGLVDASNPFLVGDVGKLVRIRNFGALNASKGNSLGLWEISARADSGHVTLRGESQPRGTFVLDNDHWLVVRGNPEAFVWPDHRGHSVQIIDGVNAGTYPILAIINPATMRDVEEPPLASNHAGANATKILSTIAAEGTGFSTSSGPSIRVAGTVGGVATVVTYALNPNTGTDLATNWDVGSIKSMDLIPLENSSNRGQPVFKGILRLINVSDGSVIAEIPPGETHFGKPLTVVDAANWTDISKQRIKARSNIVLLNTSGFTLDGVECNWRIVPNFPADSAVTYELIDAGTDAGGNLTLRAALPFDAGTVMAIHASKVLSAYLYHEKDLNVVSSVGPPAAYKAHPFYLYDGFGYIRQVLDTVRAAGIFPDFDRLIVDNAGEHIVED